MKRLTLACLLLLVPACTVAAPTDSSSWGAPALDRLGQSLNAAKVIRFSTVMTSVDSPGKPPAKYMVSGAVQKPNLIDIDVYAVKPNAGYTSADLVAALKCDGKTYSVESLERRQYAQEPAPKEGFEPDSPDVMYFLYNVLKGSGPAGLNVAELFDPADFNIADDKLPDGMTRKIEVTSTPVWLNYTPAVDITQRVTGAHGTSIYHTVVAGNPSAPILKQWRIDSIKSGRTVTRFTCTFNTLDLNGAFPAQFSVQPAANEQPYQAPALPGTKAPEFMVMKPDGSPVHLSDYRGKVVVIDFWATWCPPCRATLPSTDKLAAQYQPKGVVFMPVCTWDTKANFDKWAPAHKSWAMTWLFDPAADDNDKSIASTRYAVSGIPTQYVIGKDGRIVYRGFADTEAGEKPLVDAIDKALGS